MKREALKELGEVPMILLLFVVAIAAGAFSSLWIAHVLDQAWATGINLPPLLFMGRTFLIGFFSSCIAISAFLLCLIVLILYNAAHRIEIEDGMKKGKRGHARTRKY
jgi:fumarate reductase subunit D